MGRFPNLCWNPTLSGINGMLCSLHSPIMAHYAVTFHGLEGTPVSRGLKGASNALALSALMNAMARRSGIVACICPHSPVC